MRCRGCPLVCAVLPALASAKVPTTPCCIAVQAKTYKNFKHEKTMLQWLALEHGHTVIYGVRFHCECAVVEAMWAYIVSEIRDMVDGTASTLFSTLVNLIAFTIKPDIAGRLFNRPTEAWMLYTLGVCLTGATLPPGTAEISAGLSAADTLAIQRAYSGYGNAKAGSGSAHPRASLAGARADAHIEEEEFFDEADPLEVGDSRAAAPPRAAVLPAPVPVGAAPGGAAAGAAAAPVLAPAAPHAPSLVPPEVPDNLWELLSCVKEPARRRLLDYRRTKPEIYDAFVAAVQRGWDSVSGRGALRFLADKTRLEMTPEFALRRTCVLALRVRVWPTVPEANVVVAGPAGAPV